ncbi:MAG TPA: 4-hydroxybenzoate octaprenyltransferase [Aestuariivirga sp.]|nr:4-hydroxybenzoate octaprenyltransferase [Aestuariivirga sp.]
MVRLMYTAPMGDASKQDVAVADAVRGHWADHYLPRGLRPYARLARLERPIGWWLLLLPCWWGLMLAQIGEGPGRPNLWYALLFLIGAIAMRGAGCTLNDIIDRDFDARVARTRSRPIPSGQVSVGQAIAFLLALCIVGLLVLVQFNRFTIVLGASSLGLAAIYPFMKRVTYWPQLFLGLAFNWGALVGWSAVQGHLSWPPILLYLGGICWTLAYDTIYAHQDKEDDLLIGVKSTALKFGDATLPWLAGFFTLALLLLASAFLLAGASPIVFVGVAGAALQGAWQVWRFRAEDPQRCLEIFRSNRIFGLIITAFLLLDILVS